MSTDLDIRPAGPLPTPAEAAAMAPTPKAAMAFARECAAELATVLEPAGMTVAIGGERKHIRVEGWQTLAAMTGQHARVAWTREYEHATRGEGWEARAEVVDSAGQVVGAGEGMCLRTEKRWRTADEFSIRSMAQTRALSRALSSVLRHVVVLAGFEGTPAEELPDEDPGPQRVRRQSVRQRAPESAEERQRATKRARWQELRLLGLDDSELARVLTDAGIPSSDALLDDATFERAKDLVWQAAAGLPETSPSPAGEPGAGDGAEGPAGEHGPSAAEPEQQVIDQAWADAGRRQEDPG